MRFLFIALIPFSASAADYFVAGNGNDNQPGSEAQPWRTIQKAADSLKPGDTVFVRGGIYGKVTMNVSGTSPENRITFTNYPGESPVIDASGVTPPSGNTGLFFIESRKHITIRGFELRNYKTTNRNLIPAGVFISGSAEDIEIRKCNIHNIWNSDGTTANSGNAFGIAVYGDSVIPAKKIIIAENNIHHLKTGASESVVINGNVTAFEVSQNLVHDNNNIGIDFIGFEGTCPDAAQDQARDGVCRGNTVWNITSQGNQAYDPDDFSAGGIYCDGAARITIEGNISHHNDIGVELAAERPGKFTTGIVLRNNFIHSNRQTGLFLGGYQSTGTGGTQTCFICGNSFYNNDTLAWGNGEIQLRYRTLDCQFTNNIFSAGAEGFLITNPVPAANNVNNRFNYNLYFSPASGWNWKNANKTTFAAWKTASSQDAQSIFADPKFLATGATPDLHLQMDSPAIDHGDPAFVTGNGELDIDSAKRVTGPHIDIGADELAPVDAWRVKNFGANAIQPALAGDPANPSGDGIPNLLKYAFSLDPRVPSTTGLPRLTAATSYLTLQFNRAVSAADISCKVQVSEDLVQWRDGSSYGIGGDISSNEVTAEISRIPSGD